MHGNIVDERGVVIAEHLEDQVGWTLRCVKAVGNLDYAKAEHAAKCFSKLQTTGKDHSQPYLAMSPNDLSSHVAALRSLATDLARE